MEETKATPEQPRRVLARILADDLQKVSGGVAASASCGITGEPTGNLNGSDITNVGGDSD